MLREFFCFFARLSLLPSLLRSMDGVNNPIIVSYHDPSPEVLRTHLEWYNSRFSFITMDELIDSINSKKCLPKKAIVLTFDDGHKGNYDLIPLFKEFKVKPTIYVCSGLVNTTRKFWFKMVDNPQPYKKMKHEDRIELLKNQHSFSILKEYGNENRDVLTKKELLELSEVADIGCHTRFHPILTTMKENHVDDEIFGAKKELELLLNSKVNHFAYPNGDFSSFEKEKVKKNGFRSARTINCNVISNSTNAFDLPVIGVDDNDSTNMLAIQISRLPKRLSSLIKRKVFSGDYSPIKIIR